jgi:hypothetical protein
VRRRLNEARNREEMPIKHGKKNEKWEINVRKILLSFCLPTAGFLFWMKNKEIFN